MIRLAYNQKELLTPLFSNIQDSLVTSCIQNYFGTAWVDDISAPATGRIISGDFAFLAGEPRDEFIYGEGDELLRPEMMMIPDSSLWHPLIERAYGDHCQKLERYHIKKEGDIFDRDLLRNYASSLEADCTLKEIDHALYDSIMASDWCRDFCSQFADWEHYHKKGMGFVACKDGTIVSGASSYTSYREGIEIQITTHEDYRRKGLALVCASALMLKALEHHLYPNWDAGNKASVGVATKLGYHYDRPYTAYLSK